MAKKSFAENIAKFSQVFDPIFKLMLKFHTTKGK